MSPESAETIDQAAYAWIARLDREGASPDLVSELDAWLAGDPRRRGAYLRAEAIWSKLDRAALAASAPSEAEARPRPRVSRRGLIGAGAALAAGLAGVWVVSRGQVLATAVGERRHLALADGSTVDVNTASRLQVTMQRHLRRIRLAAGEAWFQVEKDASRPFVVEAGRVRVQAVGTAFAVRRLEDGAEVYVTEGVVESWVADQPASRTRIAAGQTVRMMEAATVPSVVVSAPAGVIDRKLAWRGGRIEFDGETLAEAIADFNRYNARKLRLGAPELAGRRLQGVFHSDDPEGFARSAAVVLGSSVTPSPSEIVIGGPNG
jgi:transmembrane sensor